MTSLRSLARGLVIVFGYTHPAVVVVALRRGPTAAKRYLQELYRCSRTGLGAHLPAMTVEQLFAHAASFQVLRPEDSTRTMSTVESAALSQILVTLQPKKMVEIGTFRGVTTLNIALNAPEAVIHTVHLPLIQDPRATVFENADAEVIRKRGELLFQGTPQKKQTQRHLGDSATLDFSGIGSGVDLAFIHAAHSYEYLRNDTARVLPLIAADGILLWHDYVCRDLFEEPHLRWGSQSFCMRSPTSVS